MRLSLRSALKFAVSTVALCLLVFSGAFHSFAYFVDSQTYMNGLTTGYPILYMISLVMPLNVLVTFGICYIGVRHLLREQPVDRLALLLFLNPYTWLLVTNFTKEGMVLAAIFAWYKWGMDKPWKHMRVIRILCVVAVIAIRPVYVIWLYFGVVGTSNIRTVISALLLPLLGATIILLSDLTEFTELTRLFLWDRANIEHVGRNFFEGLCIREKQYLDEFLPCAAAVFVMIPLHENAISLEAVLFYMFQIANIWIIFRSFHEFGTISGLSLTLFFVFLFFAIFLASPTFGAFMRYFLPVTWLFFFNLKHKKREKVAQNLT